MKKISTLSDETMHAQLEVVDSKSAQPRKSTLEFLKQFARCYHCETKLHSSLNGIILN